LLLLINELHLLVPSTPVEAYRQKMTDELILEQRTANSVEVRQQKNAVDYAKAMSFLDAKNYKAAIPYFEAAADRDHLESKLSPRGKTRTHSLLVWFL